MILNSKIVRIDLNGVNCYLANGADGYILFDTGGHIVVDKEFTDRRDLLLKKINEAGCNEHNLRLIVLTHGDCDHAHNADFLRDYFHTKIAMHDGDREMVEHPTLTLWMNSFKYRSLAFKFIFRLMRKTIQRVTQNTIDDFKPFSPDISLTDGFSLSPFGLDATIMHMPGHTSGSIAILTNNGDLIVGDTLTNMKKPSPSPNADDFDMLYKSIDRLRHQQIKIIYPGHGEPFEYSEYKSN